MKNKANTVKELIFHFDSATNLARALGCKSPSVVLYWKRKGKIPEWRKSAIVNIAAEIGLEVDESIFDN